MKLSDFDYHLPGELIAQEQINPRDRSRLMVVERESGNLSHHHFIDIVNYLLPGDILVLNNSKVFPARLIGKKNDTGGKIELFLIRKEGKNWLAIGRNLKEGAIISFENSHLQATVLKKEDKTVIVGFNLNNEEFSSEIRKIGHVPLPPYINCGVGKSNDVDNYQTVYAKKEGSVAAPTAGLHFTQNLLNKIRSKGIQILEITLHVGLGTFAPVKVDDFEKHKMHSEYYSVDPLAFEKIKNGRKNNQRIIAVGTTTTRVLEHIFSQPEPILDGETNIFIYPGYKFKCIDGLITNFHLPKSTLLMLISAFAGQDNIKKAYTEAINNEYRFYSYGDAMLII